MVIGQDEDAAYAFILQEATAEVERQGAREGNYVSELLGDSEGEAKIVMEPRSTVVETSESKLEERPQAQPSILESQATSTKKKTRVQTSKSSKFSAYVAKPSVGRKKHKASSK
ncbi:hypothetical protein TB2_033696 [Malus domestica]